MAAKSASAVICSAGFGISDHATRLMFVLTAAAAANTIPKSGKKKYKILSIIQHVGYWFVVCCTNFHLREHPSIFSEVATEQKVEVYHLEKKVSNNFPKPSMHTLSHTGLCPENVKQASTSVTGNKHKEQQAEVETSACKH